MTTTRIPGFDGRYLKPDEPTPPEPDLDPEKRSFALYVDGRLVKHGLVKVTPDGANVIVAFATTRDAINGLVDDPEMQFSFGGFRTGDTVIVHEPRYPDLGTAEIKGFIPAAREGGKALVTVRCITNLFSFARGRYLGRAGEIVDVDFDSIKHRNEHP